MYVVITSVKANELLCQKLILQGFLKDYFLVKKPNKNRFKQSKKYQASPFLVGDHFPKIFKKGKNEKNVEKKKAVQERK